MAFGSFLRRQAGTPTPTPPPTDPDVTEVNPAWQSTLHRHLNQPPSEVPAVGPGLSSTSDGIRHARPDNPAPQWGSQEPYLIPGPTPFSPATRFVPPHNTNPNPTHNTNPNPTHNTNPNPTHNTNPNPTRPTRPGFTPAADETAVFPRIARPIQAPPTPTPIPAPAPAPAHPTHPTPTTNDATDIGAQLVLGENLVPFQGQRILDYYGNPTLKNILTVIGYQVHKATPAGIIITENGATLRRTLIPWHRVHDLRVAPGDPMLDNL